MTKRNKILKALSFEAISNAFTLALSLLWFGDIKSCVAFSIVCAAVKIVIYYIYDGLWKR